MYSHYASVTGLPSSMSMALDSMFDAAEENLWSDDDDRPAVPGKDEQELDTDYDPDPAQEATPIKNAPSKKPVAKKPAKKR